MPGRAGHSLPCNTIRDGDDADSDSEGDDDETSGANHEVDRGPAAPVGATLTTDEGREDAGRRRERLDSDAVAGILGKKLGPSPKVTSRLRQVIRDICG